MSGKGNPKGVGRPPGARNKRSKALYEELAAKKQDPAKFLAKIVYEDEDATKDQKIAAAKALMPYVHSQLKAIEISAGAEASSITVVVGGMPPAPETQDHGKSNNSTGEHAGTNNDGQGTGRTPGPDEPAIRPTEGTRPRW